MKYILSILLLVSVVVKGYSWNGHAHMTIAAIAWDRLDDDQKETVTKMLQKHPEFKKKWKPQYTPHKGLLPLGKYLMMRASMWPDEIKDKANSNFSYNRKEWHYIVQMLHFDGTMNGDSVDIQLDKGKGNVVWAIDHVKKNMKNNEMSSQLKAVYFSWLIHLTADIHQPLHTCAMFDDEKFIKGDRGGTDIYFRTSTDTTNLQRFWDNQIGTTQDTRKTLQQGFLFRKEFPFTKSMIDDMNPTIWAKEGFVIARDKIYLNGRLKYATSKKRSLPLVSDSYVSESKQIAKKRATLAGYRLAKQIDGLL